jgi:hypothetical protein
LKERLNEVKTFSNTAVDPLAPQVKDRQRRHTIAMDSVNEDDMEQLTGMLVSPFMNLQNRLWKEMLGVKNWMHLSEMRKTLPKEYIYSYNLNALKNALSVVLGLNIRTLSTCSSLKSIEIQSSFDSADKLDNVVEVHSDHNNIIADVEIDTGYKNKLAAPSVAPPPVVLLYEDCELTDF